MPADLRAIIDARRSLDPPAFVPGKTLIRATAPTYGYEEIENAIEAAIEFRPAAGRWAAKLEAALARWFFGEHGQPAKPAGYARLTNSGSSANLLAIAALMQPELGATRLRPGDEVITVAAGFPTTIAPIVQHGLVPVFVDVQPTDYNVDVSQLPLARSSRTRAVVLAHTLGFPFNAQAVREFCTVHGLWFIEDCCDAVGAGWRMWSRDGRGPFQKVGTLGDLATLSFYPAHHMTTGEGGAVLTASDLLASLVTSLRDWGRDCYCAPGKDNTCGKRFDQQHGGLPHGYDHKYTYSHLGYSLRMTDIQAAIGCAQIERLGGFVEKRRENWMHYRREFVDLEGKLMFVNPTAHSMPSPFGFLMTVREGVDRAKLITALEARKIQTRPLFAGNILRQPAMQGVTFRTAGALHETDRAMRDAFWIGVHPWITRPMLDYVVEVFHEVLR